jgi:hypothetical protein
MAVKLNQRAYDQAIKLIAQNKLVLDKMDDWSEHRPSTAKENEFIEERGLDEYEKWHLGIDDAQKEGTKRRYKFPYGDFEKVHRCAVVAAKVRAAEYKDHEIEVAAGHLHEMLNELR